MRGQPRVAALNGCKANVKGVNIKIEQLLLQRSAKLALPTIIKTGMLWSTVLWTRILVKFEVVQPTSHFNDNLGMRFDLKELFKASMVFPEKMSVY